MTVPHRLGTSISLGNFDDCELLSLHALCKVSRNVEDSGWLPRDEVFLVELLLMVVIEPLVNLGPLEASGATGCVAHSLLAVLAMAFVQLGHVLDLCFSLKLPSKLDWLGLADDHTTDFGHTQRSLGDATIRLGKGCDRHTALGS